jgi:hypothetical protein
VIRGALIFTLLSSLVLGANLTDLNVESKTGAGLAPRMTLPADGFSSKWFEISLLLRTDPFIEISIRARLVLVQTTLNVDISIDDGLFTRVTTGGSNCVLWSFAAVDAVCVAGFAFSAGGRIFAVRAGLGAEGAVANVLAARAVSWAWTVASVFALGVACLASLLISLVNSKQENMHKYLDKSFFYYYLPLN